MGTEKINAVTEARRQLEAIHATLKSQSKDEDFTALLDAVVDSITDEELAEAQAINRKARSAEGEDA